MSAAAVQAKRADGMAHLTFAVDCALTQHLAGRVFLLEHPAAVTSGQTRELQDLGSCAGVFRVAFNQCMTGPQQDSKEETHEAHVKLEAFCRGLQREHV